jgi:hypothetical protein
MGYWIVLIIVGGLLFIYFNFRINFKFNLTTSYVKIKISYKLFQKSHVNDKKFYYVDFFKKNKQRYQHIKSKKYFPYLKHLKKVTRLFLIKNIYLYPECLDNSSSFVVEFIIVNNIIKRPLLK